MTRLARGIAQWNSGGGYTAPAATVGAPQSLSELLADYPGLDLLRDLWQRAKPDDDLPRMSAIDPVDLGRGGMLPFVWIIRGSSVEDYHLSLVGSEIRANFAFNPVGQPLRTILTGELGEIMFQRVCKVLSDRTVHYSRGPVVGSAGRRYLGTRVMFPLIDDSSGHGTTALIGGFQKADETDDQDAEDEDILSPTYALQHEAFFDVTQL